MSGRSTVLHVLDYYRKYWPRTKLIVGVRNPIEWFPSLYNFRIQNLNDGLPPPNDLIGRCRSNSKSTCTDMGNFALYLMRLGKQHIPQLLGHKEAHVAQFGNRTLQNGPLPSDFFLFDVAQLSDRNTTRVEQFKRDMERFLGLSTPLAAIHHHLPGKPAVNPTVQAAKDAVKIKNIREAQYSPLQRTLLKLGAQYAQLQRTLLKLGQQNGEWIRDTFVQLPGV